MVGKHTSDENTFGGTWSIKKLECVESYLSAYLNVMSNQDWANLWYIDAFSGDGRQRLRNKLQDGETLPLLCEEDANLTQFIEGSAIRAIRLSAEREERNSRTFDQFTFLEYDEAKITNLRNLISENYASQLDKCHFIKGDVNDTLPKLLSERNWKTDRAVTFIDPFATQLQWKTVESFKGTRCDVWLLFPISDVLRLMPRGKMPPDNWANTLDNLFGDKEWRSIYKVPKNDQLLLFDEEETEGDPQRASGVDEVLLYTTRRYKTVFPEVNGPAILRTSRNSPLFALYSMVANESAAARKASRNIASNLLFKIDD